jgi:hypothetical protein
LGRKLLAVCDSEPVYAKGLMEQICRKGETAWQVRVFSDAGQLFQYSKKHEIEMLLMDESYPEELRRKIPARKRFLLFRETPEHFSDSEKGIFKYQSARQIANQLFQESGESVGHVEAAVAGRREELKEEGQGKKTGIIGVYSPIHRIGKTSFALSLAEQAGKEGAALYLNLEEYSGMDYCLPIAGKENLGDLLYYMKQAEESVGYRLSAMVCQSGSFDYIEPIPVTRDLREVAAEEWKALFQKILEESIYRTIVLDLGDCVRGLFEILRICSVVYTPFIEERGARAKLRQYTENLRQLGYEDVMEHTIQKELTEQ